MEIKKHKNTKSSIPPINSSNTQHTFNANNGNNTKLIVQKITQEFSKINNPRFILDALHFSINGNNDLPIDFEKAYKECLKQHTKGLKSSSKEYKEICNEFNSALQECLFEYLANSVPPSFHASLKNEFLLASSNNKKDAMAVWISAQKAALQITMGRLYHFDTAIFKTLKFIFGQNINDSDPDLVSTRDEEKSIRKAYLKKCKLKDAEEAYENALFSQLISLLPENIRSFSNGVLNSNENNKKTRIFIVKNIEFNSSTLFAQPLIPIVNNSPAIVAASASASNTLSPPSIQKENKDIENGIKVNISPSQKSEPIVPKIVSIPAEIFKKPVISHTPSLPSMPNKIESAEKINASDKKIQAALGGMKEQVAKMSLDDIYTALKFTFGYNDKQSIKGIFWPCNTIKQSYVFALIEGTVGKSDEKIEDIRWAEKEFDNEVRNLLLDGLKSFSKNFHDEYCTYYKHSTSNNTHLIYGSPEDGTAGKMRNWLDNKIKGTKEDIAPSQKPQNVAPAPETISPAAKAASEIVGKYKGTPNNSILKKLHFTWGGNVKAFEGGQDAYNDQRKIYIKEFEKYGVSEFDATMKINDAIRSQLLGFLPQSFQTEYANKLNGLMKTHANGKSTFEIYEVYKKVKDEMEGWLDSIKDLDKFLKSIENTQNI